MACARPESDQSNLSVLREPVYGELLALESGNTLPWM